MQRKSAFWKEKDCTPTSVSGWEGVFVVVVVVVHAPYHFGFGKHVGTADFPIAVHFHAHHRRPFNRWRRRWFKNHLYFPLFAPAAPPIHVAINRVPYFTVWQLSNGVCASSEIGSITPHTISEKAEVVPGSRLPRFLHVGVFFAVPVLSLHQHLPFWWRSLRFDWNAEAYQPSPIVRSFIIIIINIIGGRTTVWRRTFWREASAFAFPREKPQWKQWRSKPWNESTVWTYQLGWPVDGLLRWLGSKGTPTSCRASLHSIFLYPSFSLSHSLTTEHL